MKFKVTIGIGEYHEGIQGLNKSFKEATQSLDVGTKLEGAGDIYHVDNLGVGKLLAEINGESQQEFMEKTIYSTKNSKEKKINQTLLETLKAFFDNNLSISKTAQVIYVHRNTLLYRLRRVKEITGLDPKKFDDAVQLRIALKMMTYQEGDKV
jgi:carbohydrate diacid regulator